MKDLNSKVLSAQQKRKTTIKEMNTILNDPSAAAMLPSCSLETERFYQMELDLVKLDQLIHSENLRIKDLKRSVHTHKLTIRRLKKFLKDNGDYFICLSWDELFKIVGNNFPNFRNFYDHDLTQTESVFYGGCGLPHSVVQARIEEFQKQGVRFRDYKSSHIVAMAAITKAYKEAAKADKEASEEAAKAAKEASEEAARQLRKNLAEENVRGGHMRDYLAQYDLPIPAVSSEAVANPPPPPKIENPVDSPPKPWWRFSLFFCQS
jgi:hypothetical protein